MTPKASSVPRVLIVEDDHITRRLLQIIFEDAYEVSLASSVEEALEQAAAVQHDVLIIDIQLRQSQTGQDLLHRLRKISGYETVPAIAVTAYAERGARKSLLGSGFNAYVSKPFSNDELLEVVKTALE